MFKRKEKKYYLKVFYRNQDSARITDYASKKEIGNILEILSEMFNGKKEVILLTKEISPFFYREGYIINKGNMTDIIMYEG